MVSIAVVLPEDTARWAQSLVDRGEAPSVAALLAELARRERDQDEEAAWLNAEIAKGTASGVDPRSADEIFRDVFRKHFGVDE